MKNERLVGKQKNIDVAPPKGKITGADFKKLRSMKEGGDHEVAMAQSSLQAIVEAAQELMAKIGDNERNIPGWIQDHITNAENYIEQAAQGFHELEGVDAPEEETSLVGMMEDLTTGKKKAQIKSKSEFSLKLRDIANKVQNMQGVDTKEAQNILDLIQDMLSKSQAGSIGANISKTSRDFDRSTLNIKPKA